MLITPYAQNHPKARNSRGASPGGSVREERLDPVDEWRHSPGPFECIKNWLFPSAPPPFQRERFFRSLEKVAPKAHRLVSGRMAERFADSPEAQAVAAAVARGHRGQLVAGDLQLVLSYSQKGDVLELELPLILSERKRQGENTLNTAFAKICNGVITGLCEYLKTNPGNRAVRLVGRKLVNPSLHNQLVSLGFRDNRAPGSLTLETNLSLEIPLT